MRFLTPRRTCLVTRREDPFFDFPRDLDRLMSTFFGGLERGVSQKERFPFGIGFPKLDVIENDDHLEVMAELPGMKAEDIDLKISEGVLTIKGEAKSEKEDKSKTYHCHERSFGSFERQLALPTEVEEEDVQASYKDGVLKVVFKKTQPAKEQVREIPVNAK